MIKGKRKTELSAEEILKKLTPYDLFRKYFGDFKINEVCYNHLRGERDGTPSFVIGNRYGDLLMHDFSNPSFCGNAFQLIQQIYQCSYDEALKIIDKDFNLGILSGELGIEYKKITSQYKQPEEVGKRYSLIQVVTRKFTEEELEWWAKFYQTIDDLRREHIYSIKEVYLNKKRYSIPDDELRFGYFFLEGGFWKIYKPNSEKKNKWISNVPLITLEGKENIKGCDIAFITKSRKDRLVLQRVYSCVCSTQNENLSSFSGEDIQFIKSNSRRQILMFDSDNAGVAASQEITQLFGFDYCNVPRKYLAEGINDWAGLAEKYGLDIIKQILKEKNIL